MLYGFEHRPDIMIEDLLVFLPKHFSGVRFKCSLRDTQPLDFRWFSGASSVIHSVQIPFLIEALMREITVKVPDQLMNANSNFRTQPVLREFGSLEEALEDLDVSSTEGEQFEFQEFYRRFSDSGNDTAPIKALIPICNQVAEHRYSAPGPGYEGEETQFHEVFHCLKTQSGAVCKIAVRAMEVGRESTIEEAAMMFEFQGTFLEIKNQRAYFEAEMGQKFSNFCAPYAVRDLSGENDGLILPWDEKARSN